MSEMSPARRRYLTRFLRMFMREVRWLLRRKEAAGDPAMKRCRNCAFNPGTDSQAGFESTAWSLLNALRDERPFYCHAGMAHVKGVGYFPPPDLSKLRFCAGWAAIATFGTDRDDAIEKLGRRARRRAGEMPA